MRKHKGGEGGHIQRLAEKKNNNLEKIWRRGICLSMRWFNMVGTAQ
jgi:hypothetical protein